MPSHSLPCSSLGSSGVSIQFVFYGHSFAEPFCSLSPVIFFCFFFHQVVELCIIGGLQFLQLAVWKWAVTGNEQNKLSIVRKCLNWFCFVLTLCNNIVVLNCKLFGITLWFRWFYLPYKDRWAVPLDLPTRSLSCFLKWIYMALILCPHCAINVTECDRKNRDKAQPQFTTDDTQTEIFLE